MFRAEFFLICREWKYSPYPTQCFTSLLLALQKIPLHIIQFVFVSLLHQFLLFLNLNCTLKHKMFFI